MSTFIDQLARAGFTVRDPLVAAAPEVPDAVARRAAQIADQLPQRSHVRVARLLDADGSVHLIAQRSSTEAAVRLLACGRMTFSHCRSDVEPPVWFTTDASTDRAVRLLGDLDRSVIVADAGYCAPSGAPHELETDEMQE